MTDRWATFDCYGTLIDWHAGIRAAMRRAWPDADLEHLIGLHHAVEPLVQAGRRLPYRQVGARTLRAIAAIENLPLAPRDEFALADTLPDWPAFPEVRAALSTLRQHRWRLAILSNTDPDLLAASLVQIGVPVDERITAAEAGSYKPAPGHWRQFFERTGADHARHVHVAASLYHDISPAAELGLVAVWINRLGEHSDLPRAAELTDLSQLPMVLERLVPAQAAG
ncbi:MAG TPA: HAD-IA family hydrolase [Chloroflexota bacterium]|nr:HAD-IA family hydrolase [Chloroflexota bacterium]